MSVKIISAVYLCSKCGRQFTDSYEAATHEPCYTFHHKVVKQ